MMQVVKTSEDHSGATATTLDWTDVEMPVRVFQHSSDVSNQASALIVALNRLTSIKQVDSTVVGINAANTIVLIEARSLRFQFIDYAAWHGPHPDVIHLVRGLLQRVDSCISVEQRAVSQEILMSFEDYVKKIT